VVFYGCTNLTLSTVKGIPDLSGLNSLARFFFGCSALTSVNGINQWNLKTITSLNRMFENATNFNSNIGNWDVSNVTDFERVFYISSAFNNGGSPSIGNGIHLKLLLC
jgi:surface protein